jgi:hypothetical protein
LYFHFQESEAERDKRLKKWGSFLESDDKEGSNSENMDTEVSKNIESESTKLDARLLLGDSRIQLKNIYALK